MDHIKGILIYLIIYYTIYSISERKIKFKLRVDQYSTENHISIYVALAKKLIWYYDRAIIFNESITTFENKLTAIKQELDYTDDNIEIENFVNELIVNINKRIDNLKQSQDASEIDIEEPPTKKQKTNVKQKAKKRKN